MSKQTQSKSIRHLAAAFLSGAMLFAGTAHAQDAAAIQSLKALAAAEQTTVAPELAQYGWTEANYLVDGLSQNELRSLRKRIDSYGLSLPTNIEGAIRAKTPNIGSSRRNR